MKSTFDDQHNSPETISDSPILLTPVASEYRDLLGQYLKDISIYPRVTAEEEAKLLKIIATNKSPKKVKEAKDKLVEANLRLVIKWAIHYAKSFYASSLTIMDLITIGNIALCRAAGRCDTSRGAKFSTFATILIKQSIIDASLTQGHIVRRPTEHYGVLRDIQSLKDSCKGISDEEIQRKLNLGSVKIERVKIPVYVNRDTDLDLMLERGEINLANNPDYIPLPERVARTELINIITDKMRELSPRERDTFVRNVLGGETLEAIAQSRGVTREAIRQRYLLAARKLKAILRLHFDSSIANDISNIESYKIDRRQKLNKIRYIKIKKERKGKHESRSKSGGKSGNGRGDVEGSTKPSNRRNYQTRKSATFVQKLLKETHGEKGSKPSEFDQIGKEIHRHLS